MANQITRDFVHTLQWGDSKDALDLLLNNGANIDVNWINTDDAIGRSPLHWACQIKCEKIAKVLLASAGINVNIKNAKGKTPFNQLCECNNVKVLKLLLDDPRVDTTLDDNEGCTPMWNASYHANMHVVELIIASGRDLGDWNKK